MRHLQLLSIAFRMSSAQMAHKLLATKNNTLFSISWKQRTIGINTVMVWQNRWHTFRFQNYHAENETTSRKKKASRKGKLSYASALCGHAPVNVPLFWYNSDPETTLFCDSFCYEALNPRMQLIHCNREGGVWVTDIFQQSFVSYQLLNCTLHPILHNRLLSHIIVCFGRVIVWDASDYAGVSYRNLENNIFPRFFFLCLVQNRWCAIQGKNYGVEIGASNSMYRLPMVW